MVSAADLIEELRLSGLAALIGAPSADKVVEATGATAHELARNEDLELTAKQAVFVHSGRVLVYDGVRMDGWRGPTGVAGWWIDRPTTVKGLDPAVVVRLDRERLEAIRTDGVEELHERVRRTMSALSRARKRRDRLANRLSWPAGTDPLLQTRMPYTGTVRLDVFPIAPRRWPWGCSAPKKCAVVIADVDSLNPLGEPPQADADTKLVFVVSPDGESLRVHACWACRARSVRVGRELFDLPFRLGRLERLDGTAEDPRERMFVAGGRARLVVHASAGARFDGPFQSELGVRDGVLELVSEHRLPEGSVHKAPLLSTTRLTLHNEVAQHLDGSLESFDINWLPHDRAGRPFRIESTFILQADPINS